MVDQDNQSQEAKLISQLRELVDTRLTLVDYYFDAMYPYKSFGELCHMCDYGIGIETSEYQRFKIFNSQWYDWNEGGIYLSRGYVEELYAAGNYPPLRREAVPDLPKWSPFVGRLITCINLHSNDRLVFSTSWPTDASKLLDNPLDLEFLMDSGKSLHLLSGVYSPGLGFERSQSKFIVVCLGDEAKQELLSQLV